MELSGAVGQRGAPLADALDGGKVDLGRDRAAFPAGVRPRDAPGVKDEAVSGEREVTVLADEGRGEEDGLVSDCARPGEDASERAVPGAPPT